MWMCTPLYKHFLPAGGGGGGGGGGPGGGGGGAPPTAPSSDVLDVAAAAAACWASSTFWLRSVICCSHSATLACNSATIRGDHSKLKRTKNDITCQIYGSTLHNVALAQLHATDKLR